MLRKYTKISIAVFGYMQVVKEELKRITPFNYTGI